MPTRGAWTFEQILTALADGPVRIAEATKGFTESQLGAAPGPGEWSALEILAHLRACGDVWGDCITTILQQDMPTIRAINPRTWIERTDYREWKFQPLLKVFTQQRMALLAELRTLSPDQWWRSAKVTGAGKPLTKSVHSYAEWMAEHERAHVKQIKRIIDFMRK
jgi:hypothetical protein